MHVARHQTEAKLLATGGGSDSDSNVVRLTIENTATVLKNTARPEDGNKFRWALRCSPELVESVTSSG
jgi:hypothetical protein